MATMSETWTTTAVMADAERRREARDAGVAAVWAGAASGCLVAALMLAGRNPAPGNGSEAARLTDLHAELGGHAAALGFLVLALCAVAVAHRFVMAAARRRDPGAPRWRERFVSVAPVVQAAAHAVAFAAHARVAADFAGGPSTADRARSLTDGDLLLRIASVAEIAGRVVFALSLVVVASHAQRVGLLSPGLALWGMLSGLLAVLLPVGIPMLLFWAACLALLLAGAWPGGRPPAWREGRAVPHDEVLRRRRAAGGTA